MTIKEAWIKIAEEFEKQDLESDITKHGLCYAIDMMEYNHTDWITYAEEDEMKNTIYIYMCVNNISSSYLFSHNTEEERKANMLKRAALARQFAAEYPE